MLLTAAVATWEAAETVTEVTLVESTGNASRTDVGVGRADTPVQEVAGTDLKLVDVGPVELAATQQVWPGPTHHVLEAIRDQDRSCKRKPKTEQSSVEAI